MSSFGETFGMILLLVILCRTADPGTSPSNQNSYTQRHLGKLKIPTEEIFDGLNRPTCLFEGRRLGLA
jgi:hypothetical protein